MLGEIIAQHLEHRLHRSVERSLNLGGTLLAHQALLSSQIDLYPEYTGTALAAILKDSHRQRLRERSGARAIRVLHGVSGRMARSAWYRRHFRHGRERAAGACTTAGNADGRIQGSTGMDAGSGLRIRATCGWPGGA